MLYTEARGIPDHPLLSNIECSFRIGKHCTVNKLSANSTGFFIGDMDIHNVAKDTTFMVRLIIAFAVICRCMKDYRSSGVLRTELGLVYTGRSCAVDWITDIVAKRYSLRGIYTVRSLPRCHC